MPDHVVKVLGRGGAITNLIGAAGAVMVFVMAVLTATSPSNGLALTIRDALIFGALAAVFMLLATTSVQLDGRHLVLVRLFSVTHVPMASIKRVSGLNGLEIVTKDGITYTHVGYGSSLLGVLTGNRRSTRVARAIKAELATARPTLHGKDASTRSRPRGALTLFFVLPAAFALIAGSLHG